MDKKGHMTKLRWIIFSTVTWGILAHGMALFNKYSYHDDAPLFGIGSTYASGRWMLGILGEWMVRLTGSTYYSTPLFKGAITLFCVALIAYMITDLLEIDNHLLLVGQAGILTTFPVIAGMLGYCYTAPYYLFGTLIGVLGGFLLCKFTKWYSYLFGVFLMAYSVGVYQANISVCISLLLLHFIKHTAEKKEFCWSKYVCNLLYYGAACIGFVATYVGINQVILWHKKIELVDYMGIASYGQTSFRRYLDRIVWAYKEFFIPTDRVGRNMFPFSLDRFYQAEIAIAIILTGYLLFRTFKKGASFGMQLLLLVLLVPLAGNFIYIITEGIHSLMMYGQAFLFVYFVWIADFVELPVKKVKLAIRGAVAVLLIVMGALYCRFDNICYLKAEYLQSQAISYYTTLITRIKSTGGTRTRHLLYISTKPRNQT